MTPHPQQEYIVDSYTIDEIERLLNLPEHAWDESDYDAKNLAFKLIRSRKATTPAAPTDRIGSIRTNIFMDEQKEWLIERVNAGMGEWEYVISFLGKYFATAPSELIAREIQKAYSDRCPMTPHPQYTINYSTIMNVRQLLINARIDECLVNRIEELISQSPTPAAPDDNDEFIITGFQLKQLQDFASLEFICQAIKSKPAATIRNQTLDEIEDKCVTYPSELGDMVLLSDIQSLRTPSTQEHER